MRHHAFQSSGLQVSRLGMARNRRGEAWASRDLGVRLFQGAAGAGVTYFDTLDGLP